MTLGDAKLIAFIPAHYSCPKKKKKKGSRLCEQGRRHNMNFVIPITAQLLHPPYDIHFR